ncbi:glycosyltransferase (plasmid) [Phaeobacter sp. BS23]|uniref:glycosyltransferase family 2 protein n=1 Tax=Phaeobacter sp. BS23 TaxID=2907239 RepID=UPI0038678E30
MAEIDRPLEAIVEPIISIIVPTRDRVSDVIRMLEGLALNVHLDTVEVILIDDGSEARLSKRDLPDLVPLRILRNDQSIGAARSRNRAAEVSRGKILAFLDDDAVPVPDWIDEILRAFESGFHAMTGPVLRFDRGVVSRARQARYDARYLALSDLQPVNFFAGGNSAVTRQLFNEVGGFTNAGVGGDNALVADLSSRGVEVVFLRKMKILHRNSKGLVTAMKSAYAAGRNRVPDQSTGALIGGFFRSHNAVGSRFDEKLLNQSFACSFLAGQLRVIRTSHKKNRSSQ